MRGKTIAFSILILAIAVVVAYAGGGEGEWYEGCPPDPATPVPWPVQATYTPRPTNPPEPTPTCRSTYTPVPTEPPPTPYPTGTPYPTYTPWPEQPGWSAPEPTPAPEVGTWQRLDTTGGGGQVGIAVHPDDPDVVYMASDNGGLFKTEDGGDTWFSVSSNLGAYRLGFVALDPLDPDVVYVTASTDYGSLTSGGATGEIHRSLDGGRSWEFVTDAMGFQNCFPSQRSIVIPPGFDSDGDNLSDVILVGAWTGLANPPVGGVWRSDDEGQTFAHLALMDSNVTALDGDAEMLFATTHEGGVYRSEDLGESWADIAGNMPLGHVADLAVHPTDKNTLYVTCRWCPAGEPKVWRTTDGGQSWQGLGTGLGGEVGGISKILMDRFDSNVLYAMTTSAAWDVAGVYESNDGGDSWHLMPVRLVLPDGRPFIRYEFDGGLAIEQAIDGRLFASDTSAGWRYPDGDLTDGVEEWEPATVGVGNVHVQAIEVDPSDPTVLYQGLADQGPYKSVDRGASFHRIVGNGWPVTVKNYVWNGPYYSNYEKCRLACSESCTATGRNAGGSTADFAVSRQDPNVVYSAFGSGGSQSRVGGVNKSTDGGATWQPVGFQLGRGFEMNPSDCIPYGFKHLAIDPTDDNVLFAAQEIEGTGRGRLYKTTDGGVTWEEVFSSRYVKGIEVSPLDSNLVVLTTLVGVYKSEQGGVAGSWQEITPPDIIPYAIRGLALSQHDERVIVVGSRDQGFYYTADGGMTWANNQLEAFFAQEGVSPEIATAVNPDARIYRNISVIAFDPLAPDTFYVAGNQAPRAGFGVARITNGGQDWERLPLAGLSHRNVYDLAVDSAGEFLYAGTFDGTYRLRLR